MQSVKLHVTKNPIPSRVHILNYLKEVGEPVTLKKIAHALAIAEKDEARQEGLRRRLQAMKRDGQLFENRRQCFAVAKQMAMLSGTLKVKRDGSGLLQPLDPAQDPVAIAMRQMQGLFAGDRVMVQLLPAASSADKYRRSGRSARQSSKNKIARGFGCRN